MAPSRNAGESSVEEALVNVSGRNVGPAKAGMVSWEGNLAQRGKNRELGSSDRNEEGIWILEAYRQSSPLGCASDRVVMKVKRKGGLETI